MTIGENGIVIYSKEEVAVLYQKEREKQLGLTAEAKELQKIFKLLNEINKKLTKLLK